MVPGNDDGGAGETIVGTMLEQAHDIGAALAKLDALGAAHDTTRAMVEDVKSTVSWAGDRINTLETTIAGVVERLEKLEPAKAAETAAEGAEGEAGAAIDTVDPQPASQNVAPEAKENVLQRIHRTFS
jgi:hypothetical protein